jgi:hypothetical protein
MEDTAAGGTLLGDTTALRAAAHPIELRAKRSARQIAAVLIDLAGASDDLAHVRRIAGRARRLAQDLRIDAPEHERVDV